MSDKEDLDTAYRLQLILFYVVETFICLADDSIGRQKVLKTENRNFRTKIGKKLLIRLLCTKRIKI